MTLKGWGVPPFEPGSKVLNASSRIVRSDLDTLPVPYRLTPNKESLEFQLNLPEDIFYQWVEFTNTGRLTISGLTLKSKPPFLVQGGVPLVLRPGESFRIRIQFYSEEPGTYVRNLVATSDQLDLVIPVIGVWEHLGLLYDGVARHNGKYYYGGDKTITKHTQLKY